jgi:hypothetical protein
MRRQDGFLAEERDFNRSYGIIEDLQWIGFPDGRATARAQNNREQTDENERRNKL